MVERKHGVGLLKGRKKTDCEVGGGRKENVVGSWLKEEGKRGVRLVEGRKKTGCEVG